MKTIVMIPTYNEKDNITRLIDAILSLNITGLSVIVVDDNSPDGTWEIVKELAAKQKNVSLLLREGERGRGSAGKVGFRYALQHGADYVIEMDADFSHDPHYIPILLKAAKNADVVLGSRFVHGGEEVGRGILRRVITKFANAYIRIMLGIHVKDCNSGFRCFKREVLDAINVDKIQSKGPAIVQEVLFKAHLKGFRIAEIPIVFKDREKGVTKLGLRQLAAGYFMIVKLKLLSLMSKL